MIEIIRMQKGRTFRLDGMNHLPFKQSLLRKEDGSLRKSSDINKMLTNGTNINAVLLTVSKTSDFDAYEALKQVRSIKSYMDSESLVGYARSSKQEIPTEFVNFLLSGTRCTPGAVGSEMKLGEWLGAGIGSVPSGAWKTVEPIYSSEFAKIGGHEIIHAMLKREIKALPGDDQLVKKLVSDGADWYIGLKQYLVGGYVYLGLKDRVHAPTEELTDLVESGGKMQAAPVVGLILRALPQELVMSYATTPNLADKVFKIVQLPYLRDHVSERTLARTLEVDIGL
jgi:hypothetical protein